MWGKRTLWHSLLVLVLLVVQVISWQFINYGTALAADIPAPPKKEIYVADYAGMVMSEEKQEILTIGQDLDKRFGAQLVVVTIVSLQGESIEEYANELFRKWGIGDRKKNNGVLLLISKEDRRFRIEVGYGLEGALTDGYTGEVLDGMVPYFRNGDYSAGIADAYFKLAGKTYDEYGAAPPEGFVIENSSSDDVKGTAMGNNPAVKDNPAAGVNAETGANIEDEEYEWWEYILYGIFGLALGVGLFYVLICYVLLPMLNLTIFAFMAILYIVSLGHLGSLDFNGIFSGKGGGFGGGGGGFGGGGGGGGFGGGSSGGGGSSCGW